MADSQDAGLEVVGDILERSGTEVPEEILNLDEFLGQSPLFSNLDATARKEVAKKASHRSVGQGETLIEEGSRGDNFAIVKNGRLKVSASFEGDVRTLATLGPGQIVGEVAVLMGTPRTATVVAESAAELFEFAAEDVKPILDRYPKVRERLQELIEERTDKTIEVFLGRTPED